MDDSDIKRLFDQITWAVFIYFNDDIFSMCEQYPYKKGTASTATSNLNLTQLTADPNSLISRVLEWHKNTIVPDAIVGAKSNDFSSEDTSDGTRMNVNGRVFFRSNNTSVAQQQIRLDQGQIFGNLSGSLNNLISNWTVNGVMRAAQWLQRNNLLSSRLTEYLNAKFGVTPTAARLDQAEYIGHAGARGGGFGL